MYLCIFSIDREKSWHLAEIPYELALLNSWTGRPAGKHHGTFP